MADLTDKPPLLDVAPLPYTPGVSLDTLSPDQLQARGNAALSRDRAQKGMQKLLGVTSPASLTGGVGDTPGLTSETNWRKFFGPKPETQPFNPVANTATNIFMASRGLGRMPTSQGAPAAPYASTPVSSTLGDQQADARAQGFLSVLKYRQPNTPIQTTYKDLYTRSLDGSF